jgi:methylenetetrahydrofolate reductase (NADPH)
MLFDPESYARFLDLCAGGGIRVPILPGTRLLKSRTQARKMEQKFRVKVPAGTLAALPELDSPDSVARGVELFLELVDRLKRIGAPGIHLFVISDTTGAQAALKGLRSPGGDAS